MLENDMRPMLGFAILLAFPFAAPAETRGTTLTCSLAIVQYCDEISGCTRVSHEEANVPRFFHLDLDKHQIHGVRPDGSEARSAIPTIYSGELRLTLQGYENGRAWSASIGDDGGLSMTAVGEGLAMAGFGACEPQ